MAAKEWMAVPVKVGHGLHFFKEITNSSIRKADHNYTRQPFIRVSLLTLVVVLLRLLLFFLISLRDRHVKSWILFTFFCC